MTSFGQAFNATSNGLPLFGNHNLHDLIIRDWSFGSTIIFGIIANDEYLYGRALKGQAVKLHITDGDVNNSNLKIGDEIHVLTARVEDTGSSPLILYTSLENIQKLDPSKQETNSEICGVLIQPVKLIGSTADGKKIFRGRVFYNPNENTENLQEGQLLTVTSSAPIERTRDDQGNEVFKPIKFPVLSIAHNKAGNVVSATDFRPAEAIPGTKAAREAISDRASAATRNAALGAGGHNKPRTY